MKRRARQSYPDLTLAALFDALAPVLIPLDVTPARVAQIARVSFVKACAKQARVKSSGRPHLARIASITGLSRAEVKRLISRPSTEDSANIELLPRALRVLHGWHTTRGYARSSVPRQLRIVGPAPSFESLCKLHSGDIPHTVILDELIRRGRVVVKRNPNRVVLVSKIGRQSSHSWENASLAFAASLIRDALSKDAVLVKRMDKVSTARDFPDSYVESAISGRLTELLNQLPGLFARRQKPNRHILNVFTLVSKSRRIR